MFDKLRNAVKNSIFVKILLGALIISFGVFGIGDFIGTGGLNPNIAIRVGEREIGAAEFQKRFDTKYQTYKQSVGDQIPDSEALRRSVMDSLIQETTETLYIENAAEDLGVVTSDDQLRLVIRQADDFKDANGRFSQSTLNNALMQAGLTEAQFLDIVRSSIRRGSLLRPVAAARGPGFLTDSLFAYRAEGRAMDTLLVSVKAINAGTPTEEDLKKVYDQSASAFMRPEYRKLSILALRATVLVKPESFADEEVKSFYDQNAARYQTPEKRRVSQLVFDSKEAAEKVRASAAPGDTLAQLATKAGLGAPVDLGEQSKDSIIGKSMADAYELPLNEISQPIQTDLGWHLFATTALTAGSTTPLENAVGDIRKALAEERGLDAVYRVSTEVQDALAAGTPMEEIAKTQGVALIQVEAIDQAGRDPKGAEVAGLIDRTGLLATAFTLDLNADTGLKDLPDRDGYYVAKVEGITPPAARPFDEVRADVISIWQRQAAMAEARKIADGLAAEIGPSTTLSSLETKDGKVSYGLVGPINRFGRSLDQFHLLDTGRISAPALAKLFSVKTGEVFTADVGDGVLVGRLKEIITPQPVGQMAANRNEINTSLRNAIAGDLVEQLNAAFDKRYQVSVNDTIVDQMVKLGR